jgi:ParB family chromosome partitioning protein
LSRLVSVVSAVPEVIILGIGPAPKAGRPGWLELARLLETESAARLAGAFVRKPSFLKLSSDRRFDALLGALRATAGSEGPVVFRNAQGDPLVRAERAGKILRFLVDEKMAPGLGAFLLEALPDLLAQFGASMKSVEP